MAHTQVSSGWTLFWKYLLPTFWFVFFGSVAIYIGFVADIVGVKPPLTASMVRVLTVSFFFTSMGLFWLTTMRMYRVDMDDDYFYVTNYFKVLRYTYSSLADIRRSRFLGIRTVTLEFHEKAYFGKTVKFLDSGRLYRFVAEHPELFEHTDIKMG